MRILFVETEQAEQFSPVALTRPVFELLCGTRSVRQRVLETLQPDSWGVLVRPHLQELYQREFPDAHVNDAQWLDAGQTLVVNGLWAGNPFLLTDSLSSNVLMTCDEQPIAWLRAGQQGNLEVMTGWRDLLSLAAPSRTIALNSGWCLRFPWDLVKHNGELIKLDYELLQIQQLLPHTSEAPEGVTNASPSSWISIDPSAVLEPFVSINAEQGPVIVEAGVKIQSFTRLEGPCFIGRETQLFRANVRGETSIGPVCRIGGEIEASILHGYANKYHDGFLGHSYVCPWVNLGALTTNSDLKNDYSEVKVPLGGHYVPSGEKKVGCFIGDHAKTAIGTLFNTGSHIGVMAMVLPAGRLCPKYIPSFSRLWHGQLDDQVDFAAACQTASIAMQRRGLEFTEAHRRQLEIVIQMTANERQAAISG